MIAKTLQQSQRSALLVLCLLCPITSLAAELPWRSVEQADLAGIWRQVGVVVLDPGSDPNDPWFQAKQFFSFPPEGFRHVLVNPDSDPASTIPNEMQRFMLEEAPATQTLTWRSPSIGILKHPERPEQRIDFGLYLQDAPTGPNNSALTPKAGDLILVFYSYTDINEGLYYRLLRPAGRP